MSKSFLKTVLEAAEEQGWLVRPKDQGYLFFPPKGNCEFVSDPYNESHTQRNILYRLKKAGLKFPDEERIVASVPKAPEPTTAVAVVSPFTEARQKINAAVNLLSEAEQLINKAEADNQSLTKLRELLKNI